MCFNIILFKYTGPSLQNCCSSNIFCSKTFLYLSLLIHFQTNYCILNLADAKHVQEISPDFLILYYLRCLICCAVDSQSLPSCSTICRCVFFVFCFGECLSIFTSEKVCIQSSLRSAARSLFFLAFCCPVPTSF